MTRALQKRQLSQHPLEYALDSTLHTYALDSTWADEYGWVPYEEIFYPLALEFGVGEGKSFQLIMDFLSKLQQSCVVGFESSVPLPENWKLPATPKMLIVSGEFEDTLPNFFQILNNDARYRMDLQDPS